MVYGDVGTVTLLLGGRTTEFWTDTATTGNMALMIAHTDVLVDSINSAAGATAKTFASNEMAKDMLIIADANRTFRGAASKSGLEGTPSISSIARTYVIPELIYQILGQANTEPSFTRKTPTSSGEW